MKTLPNPVQRQYPDAAHLIRRLGGGPEVAPNSTTLEETKAWLTTTAGHIVDFMEMMEALAWRIVASGAPLDRFSTHVGTLHPQLAGLVWRWEKGDGLIDECAVDRGAWSLDSFRLNPIAEVLADGLSVRVNLETEAGRARFPLMAELAEKGVTDYLARPAGGGGDAGHYNALTMATTRPGGFSDEEFSALNQIFDIFALHVDRHISDMIARNLLDTYLGPSATQRVLSGRIARGEGERVRAVVWSSDLRGFSDRSENIAAEEATAMLNHYFGALAGAVMDEGGEVLKFIGDGMLAVFPIEEMGERGAACAALRAAMKADKAVDAMNAAPPEGVPRSVFPLQSGVGLHIGEVFFGNIGAPERLDFTIIGRAVNKAARVEALTKTLGRKLLMTEKVAALVDARLTDLGPQNLRGFSQPERIFTPA